MGFPLGELPGYQNSEFQDHVKLSLGGVGRGAG